MTGGLEIETLLSEYKTSNHVPHHRHNGWNMSRNETPDMLSEREIKALDNVKFIADHLLDEAEENKVRS